MYFIKWQNKNKDEPTQSLNNFFKRETDTI